MPAVDHIFLDSSLAGFRGTYRGRVYACPVINSDMGSLPITQLEMLNVLVATKLWGPRWANRRVNIFCDNLAVVQVLQSGSGRDPYLLAVARNVWLYAAKWDIEFQFSHIPGKHNNIADLLSRWFITGTNRTKLGSYFKKPPIWEKIDLNHLSVNYKI